MTQPLRAWHRRAFFMLCCALPAIFIAGLAARRPPPPVNPSVSWDGGGPKDVRWHAAARFPLGDIRQSADRAWIELRLAADAGEPDLLAYWSPAGPPGKALPHGARLLGALSGHSGPYRFPLPRTGDAPRGHLVLYSLAHQALAASIRLGDLP